MQEEGLIYSPHMNFQHPGSPFFADGCVEKPCCRLLQRRFFTLPSTKNEPPKC